MSKHPTSIDPVSRPMIDPALRREFDEVAASLGCQVLACERVQGSLRVVLDHPDGITLDHCQTMSRQISAILDVEDYGTGKYVLEVTSPGLDRKFYRAEDYERFLGRQVRVTFIDVEDSMKKTVVARLETFEREREETLDLLEEPSGKHYRIPLKNVQVARLEPQL